MFLKEFIKNKSTGALCASSQKLARAMIKDVGLENAKSIVEIGAGTGSFTQLILKEKPQDALFFAIEQNPLMAKELLSKFTNLDCEVCNAKFLAQMLEKRGLNAVDLVISGIPWTILKNEEQDELLALIHKNLKRGAYLSTFLYVLPTLAKRKFTKKLYANFSEIKTSKLVYGNIPPAIVYYCRK
ncbi:methyltransferase domain-containing protein [Helicobacter sp. Faydin-H64]|uniref:Methyltransferase domain-containing protein n=1 Tax=Helicobacter turcicus TaxID=2867412 RepID=A0ABS7JLF4_9HELI|nr:methyltransferase domain-containing protein [Helicobacter turcicus]MBX7545194.1 methyltransferase domain-containing protein [Helicobacter turcicus]